MSKNRFKKNEKKILKKENPVVMFFIHSNIFVLLNIRIILFLFCKHILLNKYKSKEYEIMNKNRFMFFALVRQKIVNIYFVSLGLL